MKKIFSLCFLILSSSIAYSSITAITENGDAVILKEDGSWSYSETNSVVDEIIEMNDMLFTKGEESTFNLKSKVASTSFWIDPKEWKFELNKQNSATEYTFSIPNTDLYGVVISEGLGMQVEELVKVAFKNAKSAAPDTRVLKKEYRMVNGHKVIHMVMRGTIQSIDFTYTGYYYSNKFGATQFLVYTGTNLLPKYEDQIYSLLNGFDVRN